MDGGEKFVFGHSIGDLFGHSWQADSGPRWIWIPKPALLGEEGYPARLDEIRREGWRARKVFRVRLPPPTLIPFAAVLHGQDPDKESSNASIDFAVGK